MGMGFTRDIWEKMKCAKDDKLLFCHFDDYNWDWTLLVRILNLQRIDSLFVGDVL
jgi:hypothetical protein